MREGIPADSHRHVGAEFLYDAGGLPLAGNPLEGDLDVVQDVLQVQLPLQSHYRKAYDAVACRRDLFHFHLALGSDEKNLRFGIQFLQFAGD